MSHTLPAIYPLLLAAVLFCIGLFTVLVRRNLLFMLIGVEVMLNAAGLLFVLGAGLRHDAGGIVMFLFILAGAAAEVAVALALVILVQRRRQTLDSDRLSDLRG
jgi:NADH-quinone oxidoreductase subunit K